MFSFGFKVLMKVDVNHCQQMPGVPDMMDDYHQAQFADFRDKEIESASRAFY